VKLLGVFTPVDPEAILEQFLIDSLTSFYDKRDDEASELVLAVRDEVRRLLFRVTVIIHEVLCIPGSDDTYPELRFGGEIAEVLAVYKLLGYTGPDPKSVIASGLLFRAQIIGSQQEDEDDDDEAATQTFGSESYGDIEITEERWQLPLEWHRWEEDTP
jgi:hypothetical protein